MSSTPPLNTEDSESPIFPDHVEGQISFLQKEYETLREASEQNCLEMDFLCNIIGCEAPPTPLKDNEINLTKRIENLEKQVARLSFYSRISTLIICGAALYKLANFCKNTSLKITT